MKNLVYMVLFMLFGLAAFAQAPQMFNYQAVLRDAGGNVLANQDLEIEVKILKSGTDGTVVFSELHQTYSNEFGIINLQIGSESSLNGINWSDDNYFVQISVDGALMGTSQLMSVPFALHAKTAENVFSGDYNDLANTPDLSIYLTEIGNQNLANLSDVNLDNLSDNQILKYDAASGKWIAVDVSAASEIDPIFATSEAYNITNVGSGQVITDAERAKLNNIENGAQVNVKSDWNAIEGDAQILNKPEFADVATSGNYNDLNNKPDFSEFLTDISSQSIGNLLDVDLSNVSDNKILKFNASSGKWEAVDVSAASESDPLYSGSAAAGISNAGSGMVITNDERTKLAGIQDGAELNVNADWNASEGDAMILNKPNLANVATSGNYDDLSNKPIKPVFDGTYNALSMVTPSIVKRRNNWFVQRFK
jgi:hypothetical protein